jgi:hypothetical protein
MRMKWWLFACLILVSAEARTSSGYGNSIVTSTYRYTFNEHVRKSFVDGDQRRDYMKRHDRSMKWRFLKFEKKAASAVKKSGLPIAPYDLSLPAVTLGKTSYVSRIAKKAYPLNLVIDLGNEDADELFEVTLQRPITAEQLVALRSALKSAVKVRDTEEDDGALDDRRQALVDAAQFEAPVAVTHIDARFALYVGTTTQVAAAERERVLASLRPLLDKLLSKLNEKFAPVDLATSVFFVEGLQDMTTRSVEAKHFNPWGPLSSEDYARARMDLGQVSAILMIAPTGKWQWDTVAPALDEILHGTGALDDHRKLIESESERLDGIER